MPVIDYPKSSIEKDMDRLTTYLFDNFIWDIDMCGDKNTPIDITINLLNELKAKREINREAAVAFGVAKESE